MKERTGINLFVVGHKPDISKVQNQFVQDVANIFSVDTVHNFLYRIEELLELTQTSLLYFIVSLFTGILIDKIIPDFEDGEPLHKTWLFVSLQIILNSFALFFMEKIIKMFPFVFHFHKKYNPQNTLQSRVGEAVAISLVFFVTQADLVNRISYLKKRILNEDSYFMIHTEKKNKNGT